MKYFVNMSSIVIFFFIGTFTCMRRMLSLSISVFFLLAVPLRAQSIEAQVLSYQNSFARANLDTKFELVKDAAKNQQVEICQFFLTALDYVDSVYEFLPTDETLLQLARYTVTQIGNRGYTAGLLKMRLLFLRIQEESFQEACIRAFQNLKPTDTAFISELNGQFEALFYKSISGQAYSPSLLKAYAECLGSIGNRNSFQVLFKSLLQSNDESYKKTCTEAISKIKVDIFEELVTILEKRDIFSSWTAFEIAQGSSTISEYELAQITALSLSVALDTSNIQSQLGTQLIFKAIHLLTAHKWQHCTDLVVQYFHRLQTDFRRGNAHAMDLVTVINCMAVLRSKTSSNSLVVFLGLLNSDTEKGSAYNEQVVLAVIKALGELGDNNAFDYLVYVDYLNYSERIKQAARDSIARLKW